MKEREKSAFERAFEQAALNLFARVAAMMPDNLPFEIEVNDRQGNSLLRAQIQRRGAGAVASGFRGEMTYLIGDSGTLVYVDEDDLQSQLQ